MCNAFVGAHKMRASALFLVGNSLMVEQRSLTPSVLVRVQVPQPIKAPKHLLWGLFYLA